MIAMQLMSPDLTRRAPSRSTAAIERERARAGNLPADGTAMVIAQFQPLDPGIVSEAIPAFFIGRNKEGFWIARGADGQIGGIFLLKRSAQSFARRSSRPKGCAMIYPSERIKLDLENNGNGFVEPLMHLTKQCRQKLTAFIGKVTKAIHGFR